MRTTAKLAAAVLILVLSINGYSKHTKKEAEQIAGRYLMSLDHECRGVVESSIIYAAKMQFEYPELDYSKIIEKLDYLSLYDDSSALRIKAFIASSCLKNPDDFKWVENASFEELDRLSLLFQDKIDAKRGISKR